MSVVWMENFDRLATPSPLFLSTLEDGETPSLKNQSAIADAVSIGAQGRFSVIKAGGTYGVQTSEIVRDVDDYQSETTSSVSSLKVGVTRRDASGLNGSLCGTSIIIDDSADEWIISARIKVEGGSTNAFDRMLITHSDQSTPNTLLLLRYDNKFFGNYDKESQADIYGGYNGEWVISEIKYNRITGALTACVDDLVIANRVIPSGITSFNIFVNLIAGVSTAINVYAYLHFDWLAVIKNDGIGLCDRIGRTGRVRSMIPESDILAELDTNVTDPLQSHAQTLTKTRVGDAQTDYLYGNYVGQRDDYAFTDLQEEMVDSAAKPTMIHAVQVMAQSGNLESIDHEVAYKFNDAEIAVDALPPLAAVTNKVQVSQANPITGLPYTIAELNAATYSIQVKS